MHAWARRLLPWQSSARVLGLAVALALLLAHGAARADLWSYVDEQGTAHFAAEQVDARYQLYFKGSDVTQLNLTAESRLSNVGASARTAPGLRPRDSGAPAFKVPQRFATIDDSRSYKAVQKHLRAAAKQHAVDYELLKAVVAAESGFDPQAVSPKGAVGLMQLLPTTAAQYGVVADRAGQKDRKGQPVAVQSVEQKLTDPRTNIFAGARYLSYLLKLFNGEVALAVAAYNAGEGAVQRAGNRIPNYKETQGYVRTVLGLYGVFKPLGAAVAGSAGGHASPITRSLGSSRGGRVRVELGGSPAKVRSPLGDAANAASLNAAVGE
ncbi:MAG: lytic transglycosylase domain-containing protein [Ottowia sp.]|nr:lytic transglycosylase domain-containing protein [Ottowia sp.]